MILLNNVYISNEKLPLTAGRPGYDRGLLPSADNLDIFKYSLASMASAYSWSKVIIYYKLDEEYKSRKEELENFIREIFLGVELVLRDSRNEYIKDWVDTYELLDDDLIWFYCNHDHIFVDSGNYLEKYVDTFRKNFANSCASIYFSHWPEMLARAETAEEIDGMNFYSWDTNTLVDSIQIITKKLYEEWWVKDNWRKRQNPKQILFPRSDYINCISEFKEMNSWSVFVPLKEICRHFDGYSHVGITNSCCPALSIPNGFFEKNIKICFDENRGKDFTYFNPNAEEYSAVRDNGADYKWIAADIPVFWKERTSVIHGEESLNWEEALKGREEALLKVVFSFLKRQGEKMVTTNILSEIIQLYKYKKRGD